MKNQKTILKKAMSVVAVTAAMTCGASLQAQEIKTKKELATLMMKSAKVDLDQDTVTLPLYQGTLKTGQKVWYILTDSSDRKKADELGLEYAPTFSQAIAARSTRTAVMNADGSLTFDSGSVDFSPEFTLKPGKAPQLFPPEVALPGSIGDSEYSPFVKVTNLNNIVLNAPMLAFNVDAKQLSFCKGQVPHNIVHDKVVRICPEKKEVTLKLSHGYGSGKENVYISTDANEMLPATMEVSTYAPAMNDLKGLQVDQVLYAFVNGQTGVNNPQRQGFNSALSGDGSPLNILGSLSPNRNNYSPLWDIQAAVWNADAVATQKNTRLTSDSDVFDAEAAGLISSAAGGSIKSLGLLVNCPVIGFLK